MRILFLSNLYPPFANGGYEQWCQEVADELVKRGHAVCVVTSKTPSKNGEFSENGVDIYRLLTPEVEQGLLNTTLDLLGNRRRVERENLVQVRKLIVEFEPDTALIWGMWNIPRSVPAFVEHMLPSRVAYYICDYWLTLPSAYIQRWQEPAKRQWLNPLKRMLSKPFLLALKRDSVPDLELKYPICVSDGVKKLLIDSHVSLDHSHVVHGGTNLNDFPGEIETDPGIRERNGLKLLYIGRFAPEKGVHTAIRALPIVYHLLEDKLVTDNITLDLIGSGDVDYIEHLMHIAEESGFNDKITFLQKRAHSEVMKLMTQYDVLIFPSEWPEPFARTVLEAMAAGLLVIGTTTGGTGEVLMDLETGLTFPAGDAEMLAHQIFRVFSSPDLRFRLAKSGQEHVRTQFTLKSMVDQIEEILCEISQA